MVQSGATPQPDFLPTPTSTPGRAVPATPVANVVGGVTTGQEANDTPGLLNQGEVAQLKALVANYPPAVLFFALSDLITEQANAFYNSDDAQNPLGRQNAARDLSSADRLRRLAASSRG